MQLTLNWKHYTDSRDWDNTVWCAQSPFAYCAWRLRPVLRGDSIKWIEAHDQAIMDYYGSERVFDTLIEGMQSCQERHEFLAYNGRVKKLEDFARSFLNPKNEMEGLIAQAKEALNGPDAAP